VSQQGAALINYPSTTRVIVGPIFDGTRNALPAGITLLPDAQGRWWSNFGQLESPNELHPLRFPAGSTPVAKLQDGYLLVDSAHTALFEWRSGSPLVRIGVGNARVLALANDRVAWTDDLGTVVHVANLTTGRTIDIHLDYSAIAARFSPDRSRLAFLVAGGTGGIELADSVTGRVITQASTSSGENNLETFGNVPPAFEPVPFSWDVIGRLILVAETAAGVSVKTLDPVNGTVLRKTVAPRGLQQLVLLTP
jgi:hypothetical protein